jgi:hypothetical protein
MLDSQPSKDRSLQLINLNVLDFIFNEPVKLSALPLRFSASTPANLNSIYVLFSNHAMLYNVPQLRPLTCKVTIHIHPLIQCFTACAAVEMLFNK